MSSFSSLRSRWNAGCMLVWFSGFALWLIFNLFGSMRILSANFAATLKQSPGTVTLLEIAATVLLGPFVLAALVHSWTYGWRWISRLFDFWLTGLKLGFVCLLIASPYLLVRGAVKYLTVQGLIEADSRLAAFLLLLNLAASVIVLPFWGLMLLRRLPRSLVGLLRGANVVQRLQPEDLPPSAPTS